MAEMISVTTTVRCLFGPNVIPWTNMLPPSNRAKLQTHYRFNDVRQTLADPNGSPIQFLFLGGEFQLKGTPRAVEQLVFEPNAIQFQVVMTSDESKLFMNDLSTVLVDLGSDARFSWDLAHAKVYQTAAVVRLTVAHTALMSEELERFISKTVVPAFALPDAKAEVTLERLGWRVSYQTQSADFLYLPKVFTIEPRAGSKPSDRLYFTQSPTDYKKHLELLTQFEEMLGHEGAGRKRGSKSKTE